jgi:hypothetical protein
MADYHKRSCIRFVPRADNESTFIRIGDGERCFTKGTGMIGRGVVFTLSKQYLGGEQRVTLNLTRCMGPFFTTTIKHELMHVLGFRHEHQRPDRDEYVRINLTNIAPELHCNIMSKRFRFYLVICLQTAMINLTPQMLIRRARNTIIAALCITGKIIEA